MGKVVQFMQDQQGPRLPFNDEAEQAFLGALLMSNDVYDHIGGLAPEHFYDGVHQRIFRAAVKLIEAGKVADVVSLSPYFRDEEALAEVGGGAAYLANLQANTTSVVSAPGYARTITDLYRRREIMLATEEAVQEASHFDMDVSAEQIADALAERLYQVQEIGSQDRPLQTLGQLAKVVVRRSQEAASGDEQADGVRTYLLDLDTKLGGMQRSDLIVLAARPSMGKTSLAVQIAYENALKQAESHETGAAVLVASLEMSGEQLAQRILSRITGISVGAIRSGHMGTDDRIRLNNASADLESLPLEIDDRPALTVQQLRTRARAMKRKTGLGLIVVDYLQLMKAPSVRRETNRVQEVSEITAGLKALARDLDVPVLALSQLSRQVESREDKRPTLSDLRESGSIEQDADIVMFLYRHEYYLRKQEPQDSVPNYQDKKARWDEGMENCKGLCEVLIDKHRHGATGMERLLFHPISMHFENLHTAGQEAMPL